MILLLLALLVGGGVWSLRVATEATREMMSTSLTKERLAEEWYRSVSAGVTRSMAVGKDTDSGMEQMFAKDAKNHPTRGNANISKALDAMPMDPDEQALLDKINENRLRYTSVRDAMMKAEKSGNLEEATRIFDTDFTTVPPVYVASIKAFLDYQHKDIDDIASHIERTSGSAPNSSLG